MGHSLAKISRNWGLVAAAGVLGFAAGIAIFAAFGPGWMIAILRDSSDGVAGSIMAVPFALAAAAIAALIVNVRRRAQSRMLRSALNNMTQGLCMFDSAARLMLCNERYLEMYGLRPEHGRPGMPLRELLSHRAATGTFSGDPDRYVADCLRQIGEGRTEIKTIEVKGRTITLVSRPMRGGGWLATHNDLTDQLSAERERDSLRERESRRRAIEKAIASFRERVENVLKTVEHSATAMKAGAVAA